VRSDPLLVPRGVDWGIGWPVQDRSGAPVDLTGWTARAQARLRASSDEVLAEWASSDGSIRLEGGVLALVFLGNVTGGWAWDQAVYDVLLTNPTGGTSLVASGGIQLLRTVTR
jgi:hypothetical protein